MLFFSVEGKEMAIERQILCKKSRYFEQLIAQFTEDQEIRIILPKWSTVSSFSLFLKHIKDQHIGETDLICAQRLLWLADFFKVAELEDYCINTLILPQLKRENILIFLEDSYAKLSTLTGLEADTDLSETWNFLLTKCIEVASDHLSYLIRMSPEDLLKLEEALFDELVERAFKSFMINLTPENAAIIELVMKKKKKQDPFELLEAERLKISERDKSEFISGMMPPTLTWNLSSLKENFYKESEPFFILDCYWVLSIWSFKKDGTLVIAIKQSKPNREGDEPSSDSYYNKKKFFVNPSKRRKSPVQSPRSENRIRSDFEEGKVPNNCILTLATYIRIKEMEDPGKGYFNLMSLLTSTKSPTNIRVVPIESIPETGGKLTLEIYLRLKHTYSGIISYIILENQGRGIIIVRSDYSI